MTENLPLSRRPLDYFFIVMFSLYFITSMISDMVPTLTGALDPTSANVFVQMNYGYAKGCDPLFLNPPIWMRFVTGLSAFVYGPFYLVLVYAFIKGKNRIQVPAIIYGSLVFMMVVIIVVAMWLSWLRILVVFGLKVVG